MTGKPKRTALYISDSTGITAETLGNSLISQFENIEWRSRRFPFIDSLEKVPQVYDAIRTATIEDGCRPVVFMTIARPELMAAIHQNNDKAFFVDAFESFILPLEKELGQSSSHTIGKSHRADGGVEQQKKYEERIAALNFALNHDDGASDRQLGDADVVLVGVSRSGKTPASLYMAMQFGIRAANVPLIVEDFERGELPATFRPYKNKMFGLTIRPDRLTQIRQQRRPDSKYASLENCQYEVKMAEHMMRREGIRWLETTSRSVEEICSTIMQELNLQKY